MARTAVPREEVPATRLREPENTRPSPQPRVPAPQPPATPLSPAGWTLGLLFALLVNIGYPFLIALMKLPQVTGRNLLMVLSNILSRLPLLHLPTHWIKFFNRDALSISLMVVLVLGLLVVIMLVAGKVSPLTEPVVMPTSDIDTTSHPIVYVLGVLVLLATLGVYLIFS